MQAIGKISFVLAPIFLFLSFICGALLEGAVLRTVFIALATLFLILALIAKAQSARRGEKEEGT